MVYVWIDKKRATDMYNNNDNNNNNTNNNKYKYTYDNSKKTSIIMYLFFAALCVQWLFPWLY
jgi:hypothetical protein